jgi:3-oxocholest-4-en-26-oate---CoA ligase
VGFNFADLFETIATLQPERVAQIHDRRRFTWRAFDERAARLAAWFAAHGLPRGGKIGLYLQNDNTYLEATLAAFKVRAVPININYRYTFDELAYMVENADLEGFVFHAQYAGLVDRLRRRFPRLRLLLAVDDGAALPDFAPEYEATLATQAPMPPIERSGDDLFIFYTGGTTGMPKGVMYRQADYSRAVMPSLEARGIAPAASLDDMGRFLSQVHAADATPLTLPLCPLMHMTALGLGALMPMSLGGGVVTRTGRALDAEAVFRTVAAEGVTGLVIVGDTFSRALLAELDAAAAAGRPVALPTLRSIISSGAMWSREMKEALLAHLDVVLIDAMGSTEGGMGASMTSRGAIADTAAFKLHPGVKVLTEDGREVAPGSDEIGLVAVPGLIPIGYYKDEEKSRRTFREVDGVRFSFPGDFAKVDADGRVILLGRGSNCINTAGEKVFPEEVEEVLKQHPDVADAAVLGLPDDTYGQAVAAVVAAPAGPRREALLAFARERLAGYKLPRHLAIVDDLPRTAAGKMDYAWARRAVEEARRLASAGS